MIKYQIDFECHWNDIYPVSMTCGTFYRYANNMLDILTMLYQSWLTLPWILDYTFIISSETEFHVVSRKTIM